GRLASRRDSSGATSMFTATRSMLRAIAGSAPAPLAGGGRARHRRDAERPAGLEEARPLDVVRLRDRAPQPRVAVGLRGDRLQRVAGPHDVEPAAVRAPAVDLPQLDLGGPIALHRQAGLRAA